MTAIVLAAGYATRLFPFTRRFPKALLTLEGRRILDGTVDAVAQIGEVDSVLVVTNSLFAPFLRMWSRKRRADGLSADRITVLDDTTTSNEERLGSVGDLSFALQSGMVHGDALVLCSDKLFDFSLANLVARARSVGSSVNACYDTRDVEVIRNRHGCAVVDGDGRITDFQEKPQAPKSTIASVAFSVFPADTLPLVPRYLAEGNNPDAPGYYLQWLCTRVPVFAWMFDGQCRDVGTPAGLVGAAGPGARCRWIVATGTGAADEGEALTDSLRAAEEDGGVVYVRVVSHGDPNAACAAACTAAGLLKPYDTVGPDPGVPRDALRVVALGGWESYDTDLSPLLAGVGT